MKTKTVASLGNVGTNKDLPLLWRKGGNAAVNPSIKNGSFFPVLAERYVQSIKSPGKRTYAFAYAKFMQGLIDFEPQPSTCGCSYMAAQAVRMNLDTIASKP